MDDFVDGYSIDSQRPDTTPRQSSSASRKLRDRLARIPSSLPSSPSDFIDPSDSIPDFRPPPRKSAKATIPEADGEGATTSQGGWSDVSAFSGLKRKSPDPFEGFGHEPKRLATAKSAQLGLCGFRMPRGLKEQSSLTAPNVAPTTAQVHKRSERFDGLISADPGAQSFESSPSSSTTMTPNQIFSDFSTLGHEPVRNRSTSLFVPDGSPTPKLRNSKPASGSRQGPRYRPAGRASDNGVYDNSSQMPPYRTTIFQSAAQDHDFPQGFTNTGTDLTQVINKLNEVPLILQQLHGKQAQALRDVIMEHRALKSELQALKTENAQLWEHIDFTGRDLESKMRKVYEDIRTEFLEKMEELIHSNDELVVAQNRILGAAYGGTPFKPVEKAKSVFHGLMGPK
ncbi:hypothetical protein LTR37_008217 [Vermiconidia calcicola]|uniref:Uncharacterized protein n=1 Tax=Vermiconidia calcicola TaxID=1690605 RepID=A0ACC3NC43_9PEZI|nr:hypothetical protein LTR37_008217 [Vermiconidia calcicola]